MGLLHLHTLLGGSELVYMDVLAFLSVYISLKTTFHRICCLAHLARKVE